MPNATNTKTCNAADHDWTGSPFEAGIEVCGWPGCGATRESSAAPVALVDVPAGFVVVADERRAA